ncbi:MAG: hypothetical protein ACTSQ4_12370 [Candidatus Heimdallarchaeaceae archaeon]
MTGQISDSLLYNGEEYFIVGIDGNELFDPLSFDIETIPASTACWRGFQAFYSINEEVLVLQNLFISMKEKKEIKGKKPSKGESYFRYHFRELNLKMKFTGTILIARDFISEMYIHMGFQRPMSYENVLELYFTKGKLIKEKNLSKKMEELRNIDSSKDSAPVNPKDSVDVNTWIAKSFSLEYEKDD